MPRSTARGAQAAEEELRRYRDLFDFAPDGYLVTDPDGVIQEANRAAASLLHRSQKFLAAKPLAVFVAKEDGRAFRLQLSRWRGDAGRVQDWELRMRPPRGQSFPATVTVAPVRDGKGELVALRWLLRDVTEGNGAEQAPAAQARDRLLVEEIPGVSYIKTLEERPATLYVSPQVEAIFGFPAETWVTSADMWTERIHPEDRRRVLAERSHHLGTGEPFICEYRLLALDGRALWVHDEAVIVPDEAAEPRFSKGVMLEITERKEAEEVLRESQRQYAEAYEQEREVTDRLRVQDRTKTTFLEAVSHDLRAPLSAILGLAETLAREDLELPPKESRRMICRVADNARKLERLLSDLLDLDRMSSGILEPRRTPTDVAALVRRVAEDSDLRGHPVRVKADAVVAAVDEPQVERIVENLLVNAVKHTPRDTPLWVRVLPEQGGVLISVEDAGPGVPDELKELVFEPFERGKLPARASGAGIGLSLVARFAELHGGRAWVEDRPGGGACFRVLLPGEEARTTRRRSRNGCAGRPGGRARRK